MALSAELADFLNAGRVAVLTGAGCSTESGIPDYRGPETRRRARNPINFQQFIGDRLWRQRYWARSFVGFERVRQARPNRAHDALADLEASGILTGLITQNVDGLHTRAGSQRVVRLHGTLDDVVCLSCGRRRDRRELQGALRAANPEWTAEALGHAPDGDADLDASVYDAFAVLDCVCGGPYKPDVVFFGENVPRERVERAKQILAEADRLLVVGSSLTVFSGYRFVKYAHRDDKPVAILNLGETRGDPLATLKIDGSAGDVLTHIPEHLRRATAD